MKSVSMTRVMAIGALAALAGATPTQAANYAATGTVAKLSNYTLRHSNGIANGFTMIQMTVPLEGGCTYGFVAAVDKNALAIVLSAKAAGSPVTITYDNAAPSPWGAAYVCAVIANEVN
jgi:hypothetical protein